MTKKIEGFILSKSLSGCASFGKGVAEAVLEKSDDKDIRVCPAVAPAIYSTIHWYL